MEYSFSLWGKEVNGKEFDYLENEILMNVEESDFYGTGLVPRSKQHGYFLMNNTCYNKD